MIAMSDRHKGGLHQATAAVVVIGIKPHPDEGQKADHARQKHEFSHGGAEGSRNVAA